VTNRNRRTRVIGLPQLSLLRGDPQVLGAVLNRSESSAATPAPQPLRGPRPVANCR
jgi:hypothetical protein